MFKRKTKIEFSWSPNATKILSDDLEGYLNPHTGASLLDVMNFIPDKFHQHIFLAGGFAACVAGITKEYRDVDIFCDSKEIFDKLFQLLQDDTDVIINGTIVETSEYGRLFKFEVDGQKFDLVDVTPMTGNNIDVYELLLSFDVNWCMAAITLTQPQKIWIHPDALLGEVKVNINRVKYLTGTELRIDKYSKRLVRNVDLGHTKNVRQALPAEIKAREVEQADSWDS